MLIKPIIYNIILLSKCHKLNLGELQSQIYHSLKESCIRNISAIIPSEQWERTMLKLKLKLCPKVFGIFIIQSQIPCICANHRSHTLRPFHAVASCCLTRCVLSASTRRKCKRITHRPRLRIVTTQINLICFTSKLPNIFISRYHYFLFHFLISFISH